MTHFRFLVLRSAVIVALSSLVVCAERSRAQAWMATDVDEALLSLGGIVYNTGDNAILTEYLITLLTNRVRNYNNPRAYPPGLVGALHAEAHTFTNLFHSGNRLWTDYPDGGYGFLHYGSFPSSDDQNYVTYDFTEFMSLVFGQNVDSYVMGNGYIGEVGWDDAFTTNSYTADVEYADMMYGIWTIWEAEAWRRLLAAVTVQSNVWNTVEGTNQWDAILVDSTNGVPRVPISSTNLWDNSLSFVSNSVPTNSIAWGQYGTTNASPDMPQPLVRDLGWAWTPPESGAYEVKLFGFEQLDGNLTGSLAIDFTDSSWGVVNKVAKFFWALGTALFMFALLRNEWNFWTTLGGSAT